MNQCLERMEHLIDIGQVAHDFKEGGNVVKLNWKTPPSGNWIIAASIHGCKLEIFPYLVTNTFNRKWCVIGNYGGYRHSVYDKFERLATTIVEDIFVVGIAKWIRKKRHSQMIAFLSCKPNIHKNVLKMIYSILTRRTA